MINHKLDRESIPHLVDELKRYFSYKMFTVLNKLLLYWWNIPFGSNLNTLGTIYLKKIPYSKIVIGDNCKFISTSAGNLIGINHPCIISTQTSESQIIIGNNCGFSGTVIGGFKSIIIGNNVRCGANTLITDSDWHTDDYRSGEAKEVIISDNVWLGVNCVILKGVTIGQNTVIGANSVVTKSIPANVIAAGNPCKVLKSF